MQVAPLIVVGITLVLMILSIVFDWKITIKKFSLSCYWMICLVGAIICLVFGFAGQNPVQDIFLNDSTINPLKILIIFISCTSISVLLDKIGFFSYIAAIILNKFKSSQTKLFFSFAAVIGILTIFTSNDILILTFTPFICYFTKRAKIDPIPFIVSEFVCANVWSMFFFIDNPTNIYMCQAINPPIEFLPYAAQMAIPTAICGIFATFLTYFIFRKKLSQPVNIDEVEIVQPDKTTLTIGLVGLSIMVVLMAASNYIKLGGFELELWYIPLVCGVATYLAVAISLLFRKEYRKTGFKVMWESAKNLPYALIPFLLSMSVFVFSLINAGFIDAVANFLAEKTIYLTGFIAFFAGNLLNNIPMSMMFTGILTNSAFQSTNAHLYTDVYAVVAASNITALLTPIGSLAGIMFMKILKQNEVKFTFLEFVKYGAIISIPTMAIALIFLNFVPIII